VGRDLRLDGGSTTQGHRPGEAQPACLLSSPDMTTTEPVAVDDAPARVRSGRLRPAVETVLIVTGPLIFALVLPHYVIADALIRYDNLVALLHGHLPPGRYSLVGPLFATPLVLVDLAGGGRMRAGELYNSVVFALGLLALYLLLRRRVDPAPLRRFLLVLVAGSMFAAHVVHWNSEVFTAMAVAVGLAAVAVGRFARTGWGAVVLGVANTPAAVVGLALVVGRVAAQRRRLRYALVVLAALALIGAENWLRNGSPLDAGYGDDHSFRTVMPYSGGYGFDYPFFFGLLSLLLSFGKGVLFFAPGLVLPIAREPTLRRLHIWWLLFLAGLVLVYSPWFAWYGGFTWGPRFLLFASVPAALAIALRLGDVAAALWLRLLTLAVLALSIWVGICGAVFMPAAFPPACSADHFAFEAFCHYTPEFSVLWYPLVAHLPVTPAGWLVIGYFVLVFGWLAAPLARSVAGDLAVAVRQRAGAARHGWRW
jgi:hypothetical protein